MWFHDKSSRMTPHWQPLQASLVLRHLLEFQLALGIPRAFYRGQNLMAVRLSYERVQVASTHALNAHLLVHLQNSTMLAVHVHTFGSIAIEIKVTAPAVEKRKRNSIQEKKGSDSLCSAVRPVWLTRYHHTYKSWSHFMCSCLAPTFDVLLCFWWWQQ